MKCNFEIELCGIKNIVINDVLFERQENRNWTNTVTGKVVLDAHMWQRIKRMMHKVRWVDDKVFCPRLVRFEKVGDYMPKYRAWSNTESLNIEKIYYD